MAHCFFIMPILFILTIACATRNFAKSSAKSEFASDLQCQTKISVAKYLLPSAHCYNSGTEVLQEKQMLTPWIPCNSVELVSMASSKEFSFKNAIDWTAKKDRFSIDQLNDALARPQVQRPDIAEHPALHSPNHIAIINLIRNAKKTIFFNTIIFGGAWGTEIIREMKKKHDESNVEIMILRDTENVFAFANELNPVWQKLVNFSESSLGITVLRADINSRVPSGLPFGLSQVSRYFAQFAPKGVSISGKSDHTKILIIDGFTEYPSMFVGSKNPSDYNLLNYDESAIVRGPAAMAAQLNFTTDLRLAEALANKEAALGLRPALSLDNKRQIKQWYEMDYNLRNQSEGGLKVAAVGAASVAIVENNGDDTIRNTETSVLEMIATAKKNLRIYNFLPYNPVVAKVIAQATKRLGTENVKVLSDATLTFSLNVTFATMLEEELKPFGMETSAFSILKWRKTAAPLNFPKELNRIGITQQQHTKTIVVDDSEVLLGSTNFDFATLAGAFREFSVIIKDTQTAQNAAKIFDRIWNDPNETETTKEVLESGGPTKANVPNAAVRSLIINTIKAEQLRIKALDTSRFLNVQRCR